MSTRKPSAAPLRRYIDEVGDLPTDVLLGRIVLFTITEERLRRDDMEKWFKELDLDETLLPMPNKYLDAFRKATSDTKDSYDLPGGRTAYLLCRDVTSTPNYVSRQITREVKDSGKKRLFYHEAILCTFHRPTKTEDQSGARLVLAIRDNNLEPGEVATIKQVAREIETRYHTYYDYLDSQKVRAMVRAYLKRLNAIEIKGGVYFVPVTRDEELGRLVELISRFGGGCHMNPIPMVDIQRERAFMSEVFEREASQSLRDLTAEIRETLGRKTITAEAYAKFKARYDGVMDNAVEHMENLQINQDTTASAAEVAHRALTELQEAMLDG